MKNWNYYEIESNKLILSCWKIMLKQNFTMRYMYAYPDYYRSDKKLYNDLCYKKERAEKLYLGVYNIIDKWPKEYRAKVMRFCNKTPMKQEIEITKILKM